MILRYLLLLLFPIFACSGPSETNKTIKTNSETNGFISLHPAITETIFYLGAQERLLGRSDYCKNPSETEKLPTFGTSLTPNLEKIAKEDPLGILVIRSFSSQKDSLEQLTTVHELGWLTREDIEVSITELGTLFETPEKAEELVSRFKQEFSPPEKLQNNQKVLMLMIGSDIQKGQLWYIRKDSLHGEALEVAGFQNAAPEMKTTPSMSIEELISINPDIILLMGPDDIEDSTTEKTISTLKQFTKIAAVEKNQIARIEMKNIHGTGPRILELPKKIIETIESFSKK